jgi:hypothetical protein
MSKVFIGGSRRISRLTTTARNRIDNVIASGHDVIIGDANGVDKAVQNYLHSKRYNRVVVFCSGESPRNNVGAWEIAPSYPPTKERGFHYFAHKDRLMAREADFGLMLWDGSSPGTVLNIARLTMAGKISVLLDVGADKITNIKSFGQWAIFLSSINDDVRKTIASKATSEEAHLFDESITFAPLAPRSSNAEADIPHSENPTDSLYREDLAEIDDFNRALAIGEWQQIECRHWSFTQEFKPHVSHEKPTSVVSVDGPILRQEDLRHIKEICQRLSAIGATLQIAPRNSNANKSTKSQKKMGSRKQKKKTEEQTNQAASLFDMAKD